MGAFGEKPSAMILAPDLRRAQLVFFVYILAGEGVVLYEVHSHLLLIGDQRGEWRAPSCRSYSQSERVGSCPT